MEFEAPTFKSVFQTYPRGVEVSRSASPKRTKTSFRRTLVGLKWDVDERLLDYLREFQTYPRGVEVRTAKPSRRRTKFQTYPRGVEVRTG